MSGLTVADAAREVRTAASARLRDPEMTFELKDFQKPRFVVGGEVDNPGQFELRGRVTVLEAIAMAGGFKISAKHSNVVLFRRYDETQAVTRVINAKELAKPSRIAEDPTLRPGDFLFVPQNAISKFERLHPVYLDCLAVRRPVGGSLDAHERYCNLPRQLRPDGRGRAGGRGADRGAARRRPCTRRWRRGPS